MGVQFVIDTPSAIRSFTQEAAALDAAGAQQIAEISNAARAEFARLVTEQLASGSQDMTESLQSFMKNLPGQTPNIRSQP